MDGFSGKLAQEELPDVSKIGNVAGQEREINRLMQDEIGPRLRTAAESVQPVKQWTDEFRKECAPHIERRVP